ncbi:hypothetical protein [Paraburkholderia youngii]|uniref:hypothetical protein n=1 Tax=Paraburkholderia youngii TaxID=2782701 RepID=UPI003D1ACB34
MAPNDRVTWSHSERGGYGYVIPVAMIVRTVTRARVTIEVARKINGTWVREEKSVLPEKLQPRLEACAALDETD